MSPHRLCLTGQRVENALHQCSATLARLIEARIEDLSPCEAATLRGLSSDLGRPSPIRPCGLFTVNKATLMSVYKTAVTYIIILIQFKRG